MNLKTSVSVAAVLLALSMGHPAAAEDAADPNAAITAQTKRLEAQTALVNAQADLVKAKVGALGLPSAKGETTLGQGAGAMEAWLLSGATINKAGGVIAERVGKGQPVIVLGAGETVYLGLADSLRTEMDVLTLAATRAMPASCGRKGEVEAQGFLPGAALPVLGAAIGALKVDTEVQGLDIKADDRALINAVAAQMTDAYIPSEAVRPGALKGALAEKWAAVGAQRDAAYACRAALGALPESPERKADIAVLENVISRIDEFSTRASQGGKDAPSLLLQAQQMEKIPANARILRVAIEHAGGSLVKKTNLWTAFGFSGVNLTGGLVVSYRLAEADSGKAIRSGVLMCRTELTNMSDVQNGKVGPRSCAETTIAPKADQ